MDQTRIVTIVQARTGSSRLPGKALRPLAGRPLILHVLDRARAIGYRTWLATTTADRDAALLGLAVEQDVPTFIGDERDVLHRMREAAEAAYAAVVVRVTGDCPLLAPDVARQVVEAYVAEADRADEPVIVTNDTTKSGWPDGLDVEVFSMDMLREADDRAARPAPGDDRRKADAAWLDREHVTPWMRRECRHVVVHAPDKKLARLKLSVDVEEDFALVNGIMSELNGGGFEWAATQAAIARFTAKRG